MKRLGTIVGVTALIAVAMVLSGSGPGSGYKVRAIFDSAAFVVPGEDVKVAGVKVGSVDSLSVTKDNKAAVVIAIDNPGFQDFRRDATCKIQPQSLIGEQFVECTPTQPRAATEKAPPPLRRLDNGEYLLPARQTSISVALDLLGDTARLPVRQRLTLILNELGVGLAGRGDDLNEVIKSSAPALQELDQVLNLLATQNKTLKRLAEDSDTAIAPLARERKHVSGFIKSSTVVAAATASERAALATSLQRLPRFLSELRPTMRRLGELATATTPVVRSLHSSAPALDDFLRQLGPFSTASIPAVKSLGAVAKPGIPALKASLPITKDLNAFAKQLKPVGATLAAVLTSFKRNDGIRSLMNYVYYQALAVNGFDSVSHFLRAGLIVNTCSTYAIEPQEECLAKFSNPPSVGARSATVAATPTPSATATPAATPAATPPAAVPTPEPPTDATTNATTTQVMDYLFGKDGE